MATLDTNAAHIAAEAFCNIGSHLPRMALEVPFQKAVVFPQGRDRQGRVAYTSWTFAQLDQESDRFAHGLMAAGIGRGCRTLLVVRPSLEFIGLTFALYKVGAVPVLIDPGMGRENLFECLREVEPEALVAIPLVHLLKAVFRRKFPPIQKSVIVGKRGLLPGKTLQELSPPTWKPFRLAQTAATDPAAIIFTTGSTGVPKGVVFEHGMFQAQVDWLRDFYQIKPGEIDVAGFPLFALFNVALGVTTVIPDMDPTRPAQVDPAKFIEAINDHGATQSFGSPAIWKRVGDYCVANGITLPSLRRVLMAGAPVRSEVLASVQKILISPAAAHTPYGATEALPVASIDSDMVLAETAERTREGAGTCVGRPFPKVRVAIIPIRDEPILEWSEDLVLPPGQHGEIAVRGDVVTRKYYNRDRSTRLAKIPDTDGFWHRMGDVGYFDEQGRLWYCGRVAHRVQTAAGTLFTVCCEAIFNEHPQVARSALVGIGAAPEQTPVIVIEPRSGAMPRIQRERQKFAEELLELGSRRLLTHSIGAVLFHPAFPVDIRHNAKIFREKLAIWAAGQMGSKTSPSLADR